MDDRLRLVTATGLPLVGLAFHVLMGLIALVSGYIAIAAPKGGTWHRRAGVVFTYTMVATGITGAGVSLYQGNSVSAGLFTAYFVFTAFTTVRPLPALGRGVGIGLMALAFTSGAMTYLGAFTALGRPGNHLDGVPAAMLFFLGTVVLLAAIGDARMIFGAGIQGGRRIARHLWRMCFGLFIASGSFVAQLVGMQFLPDAFRSVTTIVALGAAPLVVLLYWMWRIRLRKNLRGLITTTAPL